MCGSPSPVHHSPPPSPAHHSHTGERQDGTCQLLFVVQLEWSDVLIERETLRTLLWSSLQTSLNRCSLILSPATYSTSLDSPVSLLPLLITSVGGSTVALVPSVAACSHTCTHTHTHTAKRGWSCPDRYWVQLILPPLPNRSMQSRQRTL